jgi:hypothetical protein
VSHGAIPLQAVPASLLSADATPTPPASKPQTQVIDWFFSNLCYLFNEKCPIFWPTGFLQPAGQPLQKVYRDKENIIFLRNGGLNFLLYMLIYQ